MLKDKRRSLNLNFTFFLSPSSQNYLLGSTFSFLPRSLQELVEQIARPLS